jgi:hypothetical protein
VKRLFKALFHSPSQARPAIAARPQQRFQPALETLEDRTVMSVALNTVPLNTFGQPVGNTPVNTFGQPVTNTHPVNTYGQTVGNTPVNTFGQPVTNTHPVNTYGQTVGNTPVNQYGQVVTSSVQLGFATTGMSAHAVQVGTFFGLGFFAGEEVAQAGSLGGGAPVDHPSAEGPIAGPGGSVPYGVAQSVSGSLAGPGGSVPYGQSASGSLAGPGGSVPYFAGPGGSVPYGFASFYV